MKLQLDRKNKTEHLYLEVYHYYKNLILEQNFLPEAKCPLSGNAHRNLN